MAIETDLAIRLRRALIEDHALRAALIRTDHGVTPMIFQYNPLAYYIETNARDELVLTMSRPYHIAPKIRCNIHDRGHVMRMPELRRRLRAVGSEDLLAGPARLNDLPLLFLYGRSDMSVDYYGANVTPDSVREVLFGVEALAPVLNTFRPPPCHGRMQTIQSGWRLPPNSSRGQLRRPTRRRSHEKFWTGWRVSTATSSTRSTGLHSLTILRG